jgi:hypothetical protein
MKHSKIYGWMPSALVGLALSASVGLCVGPITVDTYDSAATIAGHTWSWYGGATWAWDSTQDHTGNGGGAIRISHLAAAGDTIMVPETFAPGSGVWWPGTPIDCTTYTNISAWFKWDTNASTMGINTMNTEGTGGFGIGLQTSPSWDQHRIMQQIPLAASNGWVHMNFPLNATMPNINLVCGVDYVDWKPAPWSGDVAFWVDDVVFQQGFIYVPPPIVKPLATVEKGLQVSLSTSGSLYDRQSAYCITNTGKSWWNVATPGNPVEYKFTINSFPTAFAQSGCEAWMFLSPNPTAIDNAPDWNQANMVIAFVQYLTNNTAVMHVQYKVNEPSQQAMYSGGTDTAIVAGVSTNYLFWTNAPGSQPGGPIVNTLFPGITETINESGNLCQVTNPVPTGTWTIRFTSNTNLTVIAPGGDTTNVVITPYYANYLDPAAGGMRIFLGGQANNAAAENGKYVYSDFSVTGSAEPISDNFLTDLTLNTNLWSTAAASGPAGVLIVPASAKYWVTWTSPAGGFSLQCGSQVHDLSAWTSPTMYPVVPFTGLFEKMVDSTEVPAGPNAFFNLILRSFTQLQVILPGETAVAGPGTGKTGTPTPVSIGAGGLVNVTVNACDATWHVISGVYDTVQLSTSDGASIDPAAAGMSNGTITFPALQFNTVGSQTVTATDVTDGSKLPNTSTPVAVVP